jgi:K+-sensing histidine kinase KdpD
MTNNRGREFLLHLRDSLLAVGSVIAITIPLYAIGSATLGDAVIALLYLIPIAWSAGRWGLLPGLSAGLSAALCFDFLFVPPFYTFAVGSLEGWLVLAIFLAVAVFVVARIQASLIRAREAVFFFELSKALADKRSQEAVAQTAARHLRRLFQAATVTVFFKPTKDSPALAVEEPKEPAIQGPPDRVIPIENAWGVVGDIQIWRGPFGALPAEDSKLMRNFSRLTAEALERTRMTEARDAEFRVPDSAHPPVRHPN